VRLENPGGTERGIYPVVCEGGWADKPNDGIAYLESSNEVVLFPPPHWTFERRSDDQNEPNTRWATSTPAGGKRNCAEREERSRRIPSRWWMTLAPFTWLNHRRV